MEPFARSTAHPISRMMGILDVMAFDTMPLHHRVCYVRFFIPLTSPLSPSFKNAGNGFISAQAFEGIIPMLKAGLNQSVHSDPAGLREIDQMFHRMTT